MKELSNVNYNTLPNGTTCLLRSLIDTLAYENSDRTKHENLTKPYLNNIIKTEEFSEFKKDIENLLKDYDILSSVVHGQNYVTANICCSFVEKYYDLIDKILELR